MRTKLVSTFLLAMAVSALLAGCAAPPPPKPEPPPPTIAPPEPAPPVEPAPQAPPVPTEPPVSQPSASMNALTAALQTFERGEYAAAIRQLAPLTTDTTLETANRLRAFRSLAFAQCLTRAVTACRQTFERAFRLDRSFELAPAERGHPIWGPQFERARKAVIR